MVILTVLSPVIAEIRYGQSIYELLCTTLRNKKVDAFYFHHCFIREEREIRLMPIAQIGQLKTH